MNTYHRPTAEQIARALVDTTDRFEQGLIKKETWKVHVNHLARRAREQRMVTRVKFWIREITTTNARIAKEI